MSIEATLSSIAKSLEIIANHVQSTNTVSQPVSVVAAPAPVAAVVAPAPVVAPVVQQAVAPVVQAAPAPTAPVAPVMQAAPAAVAAPAPGAMTKDDFTKRLLAKYQKLGPVDGTKIQSILASAGFTAVNAVTPEMFESILATVEAL